MSLAEWGITGETTLKFSHKSVPALKMSIEFSLKEKGFLFKQSNPKIKTRPVIIQINHETREDWEALKNSFKEDDTLTLMNFCELVTRAGCTDPTYDEAQQTFFVAINSFLKGKPAEVYLFFNKFVPLIRQLIYVN